MNYWDKRAAKTRLETEGVEVEVEEYPGWKFRVRPASPWSAAYQRALARVAALPEAKELLARQSADDYSPTAADADVDAALLRSSFSEGCLAGWEGVTDDKGEPLPYSVEAATALFTHFPDILRALQRVAANEAAFQPPADKIASLSEGNLKPASNSQRVRGGTRSARSH